MRKLLLLLPLLALGQDNYLNRAADPVYSGYIGSSTVDIKGSGDTLWFGTSNGLSASFDNGESFISFDNSFAHLGYGSVSALEVRGDTIWAATAFDSTTLTGDYDTGGGITRSFDAGASWEFLGQPMDSLRWTVNDLGEQVAETYSELIVWGDTLLAVDVVTPINNPSYDLSFDGKRLWSAQFAAGLRVSHDFGDSWERVLLPWDNTDRMDSTILAELREDIDEFPTYYALDPVPHLNYRVFSVVAYGDTVWAGSAAGINHSTDGGKTWVRYSYQNSNVTGNFVVALHRQQTERGSAIWATSATTDSQDRTGISLYRSWEGFWRAPVLGHRPYNFGSSADAVYAGTEYGLMKSSDGLHFSFLPSIEEPDGSEIIYSDAFFCIFVNSDKALWIGSKDGIAVSRDEGLTWSITKSRPSTELEEFIAFPNPFTPRHDKVWQGIGHALLRFDADQGTEISLTVFDFSMRQVRSVLRDHATPFDGSQEWTWDGRNDAGYLVANGTYFIRLEKGDHVAWTKLMVLN